MAGINRVDQMIAYYLGTWKTIKWTKKVFLELTMSNARLLHN